MTTSRFGEPPLSARSPIDKFGPVALLGRSSRSLFHFARPSRATLCLVRSRSSWQLINGNARVLRRRLPTREVCPPPPASCGHGKSGPPAPDPRYPSNHHHPPPHPTCRFCACLSALLSASARGYGRDLRSAAAAVLADTPSMCPLPRLRAIAPSMAACALSRISSPFVRMLHIVSHCPARREAAFSPLSML